MAGATGAVEIDFGSGLGSNEASVAITGQSAILSTSYVESWMMAEASTEHTLGDQTYAQLFMSLTCGVPTDATGFTIYARSTEKLTGKFKIRWVWV